MASLDGAQRRPSRGRRQGASMRQTGPCLRSAGRDYARAMSDPKDDGAPSTAPDEAPRPARLTANDFHPEVLKLFDAHVHGLIDRRGFIDRAAKFALAGTTALGLLDALSPKFAQAQQV